MISSCSLSWLQLLTHARHQRARQGRTSSLSLRSLGFTGGKATQGSKFGRVPDNFIMDDVKCLGKEVGLPSHDIIFNTSLLFLR